jgi:ABC-type uncharacterized transport system substrate-binding protein
VRINILAIGEKLPTVNSFREYVQAGGLISYGPNFPDLFRRAGDFVDKILRGVKPADLPVEQPVKFDLMINTTTAKVLGLASRKSSKPSSKSVTSKPSKTRSSKSKSSKSRLKSAKSKPSRSKSTKTKSKKHRFTNTPPKIGFLVAATTAAWKPYTDAFEQGLSTYGWVKGTDYNIDYEPPGGAAGDVPTLQNTAQQFVTTGVDIIVTAGTEAAQACKTVTATQLIPTPVVFASVGDPVTCKLVKTIGTPGGNLTGCSNMQTDPNVVALRIKSLNKMKPKMVGVIGNDPPANPVCPIDPAIDQARTALGAAAAPKNLGQWSPSDFQSVQAVSTKLGPLKALGVDVLLVCSDPVAAANVDNVIDAAHNMKMKTTHEFKEPVIGSHHGDHCYGPNFPQLFSQAAWYVYQILTNDADPSTLAVYLPSQYDEM